MQQGNYLLSILIGPVVPVPLPRVALEALQEVEVTSSTDGESGFQLRFSLSTHSVLHTLFLIAAQQLPTLRVIIVVTIGGVPNVLMDGVVERQEVGPGGGNEAVLTVIGKDLTAVMDKQDKTGLPYPAMPVPARVLACIAPYAMYGLTPIPIPPLMPSVSSPTSAIPLHQGTDLAYLRQMAADNGYVFYIEPGPVPGVNIAYWGPEIRLGVPQPALAINSDGFTNVQTMSFAVDSAQRKLPVVFIQEPFTKLPLPIPIPDISLSNPPLGLVPPHINGITPVRDLAGKGVIEVLLKGLGQASSAADAVTGTGTLDAVTYGRALKARGLVGVRGSGMAFDGLYFVKSVTSKIKPGAFTQSFRLARNGLVSTVPAIAA